MLRAGANGVATGWPSNAMMIGACFSKTMPTTRALDVLIKRDAQALVGHDRNIQPVAGIQRQNVA